MRDIRERFDLDTNAIGSYTITAEEMEDAVGRAVLDSVHRAMDRMGFDDEAKNAVSVETEMNADGTDCCFRIDGAPARVVEYLQAVGAGEFERANRIVKGGH